MPESDITTIEELMKSLRKWTSRFAYEPLATTSFSNALYYLTDFISTTLESYSAYTGGAYNHISRMNKKIAKESKGTMQMGTILPGIVADYFVPRLYGLSYLGAWGLLEQYLRDVLWLATTENLTVTKRTRRSYNHVLRTPLDIRNLAEHLVEPRKQNLDDIALLFNSVLSIDLKRNEDFKALLETRKKRNRLAHTGDLLDYRSSIEFEKFMEEQERRNKQWLDEQEAKSESRKSDTPKEPITIEVTLEYQDPATTDKNRELEKEYCDTIVHMWKVGEFLTSRLFKRSVRIPRR